MAVKKLLSFRRPSSSSSLTNTDHDDSSSSHSSLSSSRQNTVQNNNSRVTTSIPSALNNNSNDTATDSSTMNDFKSFQYSFKSNSLFSKSAHTGTTSMTSRSSSAAENSKDHGITNIGRPLRVLDEEDVDEADEDQDHHAAAGVEDLPKLVTKIEKELKSLAVELNNIIFQINQSILNLTKSSIKVNEFITQVIKSMEAKRLLNLLPAKVINTSNSQGLRKIVKVILYLIDNLLSDEVYTNSRVLVLKSFNDLLVALKLVNHNRSPADEDLVNYNALSQPKNFAIGSTQEALPNESKIDTIMNLLLSKKQAILDQEGSFVAPVLRGFHNENISCVTFMFGFPDLTKEHKQVINVFYSLIDDFHFMCQQNRIKLAKTEFRAPFRIPSNMDEPPISISISAENSTSLSGTLGGYIYPKISKETKNKSLLKYENSVFGVTCAHVVLQDNISMEADYPHVSCPSPVLINLYKRALNNEKRKYAKESEEYNAYNSVTNQIDAIFPLKDLKVANQQVIKRNLAPNELGQIIWGERLINNAVGKLSDLAIIKMSSRLKCLNYLGDDLNFNEYDPSLMFTNLYLKKVIDLDTLKKNARGLIHGGGLEVFKYGSTTKYTRGALNGVKLIYWSDGKLQTSEFVVKSNDAKYQTFASGGDSGSWILSKLQDVAQYEQPNFVDTILNTRQRASTRTRAVPTGLGVVGMLHSYDGEFKQFGLYTPMTEILNRVKDVTGLQWGVVGCDPDEGADEDVLSEGDNDAKSGKSEDESVFSSEVE